MSFDALMEELNGLESSEDMLKALSSDEETVTDDDDDRDGDGDGDDKKIQAAALEESGDAIGDQDDDAYMGKSLTVQIDGKDVEAIDGTRVMELFGKKLDGLETNMGKALTLLRKTVVGRDSVIKQQTTMIKSLQSQVGSLSSQGRGRKAVLSIVDKNPGSSDQQSGIEPEKFMQMAKSAAADGRINSMESGRVQKLLQNGHGEQISDSVIQKIVGQS